MVAALERFMRDTAPTPAPERSSGRSAWADAALLEASGHRLGERVAWHRVTRRHLP